METQLTDTPPVTEDGILMDPKVLEKFMFKPFDPKTIEFGKHAYPLNLFGG